MLGIQVALVRGMKLSWSQNRQIFYIAGIVVAVTCGHYLISVHFGIVHNVLQRLYYIPIIWAAYRFGRKGGLLVSIISSFLYLPHILITWQMHPEYQVNQVLEVILFVIFGVSAAILFERKANDQRMLQSYEKLALFGSLSRSAIRSLKVPLKSLNGMLMTIEPLARKDPALESCVHVMKGQIETVENVRNELIALVERKKLRLKKQPLNDVVRVFVSEIDLSLRLKEISLATKTGSDQILANINSSAINESLHHLVGIMVSNLTPITELTIYTGDSASHVWIGVSTKDVRLNSYYLSDLSCLSMDSWGDNDLINVVNTMNNHFGDFRFRWDDGDLIEFIFVFPKRLKLAWYLKDEPATEARQSLTAANRPQIAVKTADDQRQLPSGSFFSD